MSLTQLVDDAPRLSVSGLTIELPTPSGGGRTRVVEDVSFEVRAGETLALLGESGAGKTMTARALPRLLPDGASVRGRIVLDGVALEQLDERAMTAVRGRKVGFVFQDPAAAMNPMYSAGWHVTEAVKLAFDVRGRDARTRAERLLERVGFPSARFDAYPHELSGGMRQRVMIATALAGEPQLLIADEPTTALDVIAAAEVRGLLAELAAERALAILLISHDVGTIAELSTSVAVMYAGEIVERGATVDVLGTPRHPYTRALLGCLPPDAPRPRRAPRLPLAVIPPGERSAHEGCRFASRCGDVEDRCERAHPELVRLRHRDVRCLLADGTEETR
ncbi:MAG: ABC transporter ATP-binding protein [Deltaproteobacteria bacterium]|nr:ABC transporter ATP-binding protein [Deltaproteobacteria bacterium]